MSYLAPDRIIPPMTTMSNGVGGIGQRRITSGWGDFFFRLRVHVWVEIDLSLLQNFSLDGSLDKGVPIPLGLDEIRERERDRDTRCLLGVPWLLATVFPKEGRGAGTWYIATGRGGSESPKQPTANSHRAEKREEVGYQSLGMSRRWSRKPTKGTLTSCCEWRIIKENKDVDAQTETVVRGTVPFQVSSNNWIGSTKMLLNANWETTTDWTFGNCHSHSEIVLVVPKEAPTIRHTHTQTDTAYILFCNDKKERTKCKCRRGGRVEWANRASNSQFQFQKYYHPTHLRERER